MRCMYGKMPLQGNREEIEQISGKGVKGMDMVTITIDGKEV